MLSANHQLTLLAFIEACDVDCFQTENYDIEGLLWGLFIVRQARQVKTDQRVQGFMFLNIFQKCTKNQTPVHLVNFYHLLNIRN